MRVLPETKRGLVRIWIVSLIAIAVLIVGGSMLWSRYYWGYYVSRPGVVSEVREAVYLDSVTRYVPASFTPNSPAATEMVPRSTSETIELPGPNDDPYYVRSGRVAEALSENKIFFQSGRGFVADGVRVPSLKAADLVGLRQFIVDSGVVPTGPYNASPAEWDGAIFHFTMPDGRDLWLVTVRTTQLSNDHYAYRELLIQPMGKSPNTWRLIDARGWQYDVAGIEGAEWYAMAIGLSILAGVPLLALLGVYTAIAVVVMNRRRNLIGFEPISAGGD